MSPLIDGYQEFLKSVSISLCLSEDENRRKIIEYRKNNDILVRNEIIEGNLRLVLYVIRNHFYKNTLPIMDLIQEGCQGLLLAVETYDPERSSSFLSYALLKIKGAILDYIGKYEYVIAIPKHVLRQAKEINRARDILEKSLGRDPSPIEIASFLKKDYTAKKVEELLLIYQKTFLLDISGFDNKATASTFENPDIFYEHKEVMKVYQDALQKLDSRSRDILLSRYGVTGRRKTLEELSLQYSISKTRVRQIEEKSFQAVREDVLSNL